MECLTCSMREDEAGKPTQSEYDQLYNSPEIQYLAETQVSIGSVGTPVTAASSTAACYDKTKNTKPSAASHGQACGSCWAVKIAMTESLRFGLVAVTSTPFPEPFLFVAHGNTASSLRCTGCPSTRSGEWLHCYRQRSLIRPSTHCLQQTEASRTDAQSRLQLSLRTA